MRLYNAAFLTTGVEKGSKPYRELPDIERDMLDYNEWHLESYHYVHKPRMVERMRNAGMKVFLDSGAFSAFSIGAKIDIGQYCDYCHEYADVIEMPSVLDEIGDYKGTFKNQKEMERRGVNPLPCFHYGEPFEVGEYYANNYEYMTLGGLVPVSTQQMIVWLDEVWEKILCHPDGTPKLKVHGFGVTSLKAMLRYPWYSVDSSSWIQYAVHGYVFLPESGVGLMISEKKQTVKDWGKHYRTMTKPHQDAIRAEVERYGGDIDRMQTVHYARAAWNAMALPKYVHLRTDQKVAKFVREQSGLF